MKALLLVTYMALNGGQPQPSNMQQVDIDSCQTVMVDVVNQYGLKNHVYSSGPTYMRAHDKNGSLSVTCRPVGKG